MLTERCNFMGKTVIITEKPSVAETYAKVLDVHSKKLGCYESDDYIITWAVGHLVTMSYPEVYDIELKKWDMNRLPFIPDTYKYEVIDSVKSQFNVVKDIFHRPDIDAIYYAGDSGREGIYIQMLIRKQAGHKAGIKEKVVWIDSQTEDEIRRGIRDAKDVSEYQNMTDAGYSRAIEDYMTGLNFTRALSIKYGRGAGKIIDKPYAVIAVGRVMTCVLGIVVNREREIESFVSTLFYGITAKTNVLEMSWKSDIPSKFHESPLLYNEKGFKEKKDAEGVASSMSGNLKITKITKKRECRQAPLLFSLAELQNECTKKFKLSPAETLTVAQTLYDKKLTTYPRTDARVLTTAIAGEILTNIRGLKNLGGKYIEYVSEIEKSGSYKNLKSTKYVNDKAVTDHYAIIPTGTVSMLNSLSEIERTVYHLICARFLSIFYPAAEFDKMSVTGIDNGEPYLCGASVMVKEGYLKIYGKSSENEESSDNAKAIENLKEGDVLTAKYEIAEGKTVPPKRYASGDMVIVMENAGQFIEDEELKAQLKGSGIGTSATRGGIIQKLIDNGYIKCDKKTQILSPEKLGIVIYDIVSKTIPGLLSPKLTANWETGLSMVEKGKISKDEYLKKVEDYVKKNISEIKEKTVADTQGMSTEYAKPEMTELICPVCGRHIIKYGWGWRCEGYIKNENNEVSGCSFSISNKIAEAILDDDDAQKIVSGEKTKFLKMKSKKGSKFKTKLLYNAETQGLDFVDTEWSKSKSFHSHKK